MNVWCDAAPSVLEDSAVLFAKCLVLDANDIQRVLLREIAIPEREVSTNKTAKENGLEFRV